MEKDAMDGMLLNPPGFIDESRKIAAYAASAGSLNRYFVTLDTISVAFKIPQSGKVFYQSVDRSGYVPGGLEISIGTQDSFMPLVVGRKYLSPTPVAAWVRCTAIPAGSVPIAIWVGDAGFDVDGVSDSTTTVGHAPGSGNIAARSFANTGSATPLAVLHHAGANLPQLFASPSIGASAGIMASMPAIDSNAGVNFWLNTTGVALGIIAAGSGTAATVALSVSNFLTFYVKAYISLNCTVAGQVSVTLRQNGVGIASRRFFMAAGSTLTVALFDELLTGAVGDTQGVDLLVTSITVWTGDASGTLHLAAR